MNNETDQSDEILALQSIYGDDIFSCDVSKQPFKGCITIHLHKDTESFDILCNGVVKSMKHLSPITLNFSLPHEYPSSTPPDLKLSSLWLQPNQLQILSKKLNDLWNESCNSVILFTWVNFLQMEVLDFLDVKFPIEVSEDQFKKLKNHSTQREEEIFKRGLHECPVCFCERPGTDCVHLESCDHMFCKECLSGFLLVHITDGNVKALNCPAEKCESKIYPNVIKHLVSTDDYERYERLLLQNTLDVMNDIHYCPRPKCRQPVIIEKGENVGMCQLCKFAFCVHCKLTYHGIENCKMQSGELVKLRKSYMEGSYEDKQRLEAIYGRKKLNDIVDDFHSETWMKTNSKKCPNCRTNIERSSGCNKMHCGKCHASFCWLCMAIVNPSDPYNHFNDEFSRCFNQLFVGTDINENQNHRRQPFQEVHRVDEYLDENNDEHFEHDEVHDPNNL